MKSKFNCCRYRSRAGLLVVCFFLGCIMPSTSDAQDQPNSVDWAIAIHGGAGTMNRDAPPQQLLAYEQALTRALTTTTWPTRIGARKCMSSTLAVIATFPQWCWAATAAQMSIHDITVFSNVVLRAFAC